MEFRVGDRILVKRYWDGEYFVHVETVTSNLGIHGIHTVNAYGFENHVSAFQYENNILAVSPITEEQAYFLGVGE